MTASVITPDQKALEINMDPPIYGTFAEIGAGQEVARHFFRVGGASGTVAKSMSAYDMKFSDEIYGKVERYVSRERLAAMLDHEYRLLIERLSNSRGNSSAFFVFANTVATRNFQGTNQCHGWMGIKFQTAPEQPPCEVVLHVRMKDREAVAQQQALGAVGVNLIYAAYYLRSDLHRFISSLLDSLSTERIEIDIIEVTGEAFKDYDNRIMSLDLLRLGLTNAVLFGSNGKVYQPSEVFYKKPILVERGSFRPITHVNLDMLHCAEQEFAKDPTVSKDELVSVLEITLENLLTEGSLDQEDFLDRVDSVSALNYKVLVTNFPEFYRLPGYFRNYSSEPLAFVLGINNLLQIFDEQYYTQLEGGIFNALGKLFHTRLKLLVYPMSLNGYQRYQTLNKSHFQVNLPEGKTLIEADDVLLETHQQHLFAYLQARGQILGLKNVEPNHLEIFSREVLQLIREGKSEWEKYVPKEAAKVIKERQLFR